MVGHDPHTRTRFKPEGRIERTPFFERFEDLLAGTGTVYCAPPAGATYIERDGKLVAMDTFLSEFEKIAPGGAPDPEYFVWACEDYWGPIVELWRDEG